jgi:hypothetical protein
MESGGEVEPQPRVDFNAIRADVDGWIGHGSLDKSALGRIKVLESLSFVPPLEGGRTADHYRVSAIKRGFQALLDGDQSWEAAALRPLCRIGAKDATTAARWTAALKAIDGLDGAPEPPTWRAFQQRSGDLYDWLAKRILESNEYAIDELSDTPVQLVATDEPETDHQLGSTVVATALDDRSGTWRHDLIIEDVRNLAEFMRWCSVRGNMPPSLIHQGYEHGTFLIARLLADLPQRRVDVARSWGDTPTAPAYGFLVAWPLRVEDQVLHAPLQLPLWLWDGAKDHIPALVEPMLESGVGYESPKWKRQVEGRRPDLSVFSLWADWLCLKRHRKKAPACAFHLTLRALDGYLADAEAADRGQLRVERVGPHLPRSSYGRRVVTEM